VRNRDLWTVVDVRRDGGLTVSRHNGHGQVTLPTDYVRAHVRLGYAATGHGYEGDTVDVSLGVVASATSHRGLYVAATRGREKNQVLVVADGAEHARDVLEQVLANDRADLAAQIPGPRRRPAGPREAEQAVTAARRALDNARQRAAPHLRPVAAAEADLEAAETELRASRAARADAPLWRRRGLGGRVEHAAEVVQLARDRRDLAAQRAAPYITETQAGTADLQQAEQDASIARLRDRLDRLALAPTPGIERSAGIDPPGL
jgi:hypothetical protein